MKDVRDLDHATIDNDWIKGNYLSKSSVAPAVNMLQHLTPIRVPREYDLPWLIIVQQRGGELDIELVGDSGRAVINKGELVHHRKYPEWS